MDNRLLLISSLIKNGKGFVDVGTDHAYLPAFMAKRGYSGNIIATDINALPLENARRTAVSEGVSDRLRLICCDGLDDCPPDDIDTIVIAGMGGDMICRILDIAEWCMDGKYRLILQPMTRAEVVRYWLTYNEFEIISEHIADDNGTLYQIIETSFGGETKLNDAELFAGKRSLCAEQELYDRQKEKLIRRFEKAIKGMSGGEEQPEYKIAFFSDILGEIKEL